MRRYGCFRSRHSFSPHWVSKPRTRSASDERELRRIEKETGRMEQEDIRPATFLTVGSALACRNANFC